MENTDTNILWKSSTENALWKDNAPLQLMPGNDVCDIETDASIQFQTMDTHPWGGCFNERGWDAMKNLSESERTDVINALFGDEGLRLTAARIPMAASDYAIEPYSYDETENDYEMQDFSIERDNENLLPYIRKALEIQRGITFFSTPWTPPSWMKKSHSLIGGEIDFTPENMRAYAQYFVKYIRAYRSEGINLKAITVQNEPTVSTPYTSCLWSGEQLNGFIRDYLYPAIEKENIDIEIWLGTFTDSNKELAIPALTDNVTSQYISAVVFQWWGAPLASEIYKNGKAPRLVQSETKCGDGKNDWAYAEEQFDCFKEFLDAGVNQYFLWNMVLDEIGMNTEKWRQNSPLTVNRKNGEIIYNPSYYLTKHFSWFIAPRAVRIKATGTYYDMIAFKNPDGKIVLEVKNSSNEPVCTSIKINGGIIKSVLEAHSINTFRTV